MRQSQGYAGMTDAWTGSASVRYTAGFRCGCSVPQVGGRSLGLKAAPQERSREPLLRCFSRAEAVSDFPHNAFYQPLSNQLHIPKGREQVLSPSDFKGLNYSSVLDPSLFPTAQDLRKMFSIVEILL